MGLGLAISALWAFVGFDLTDEGLAVRGATEASQGKIFSSPFGVPLQYLWDLVGGDLRLYRLTFLLTSLVAAWLAASRVIEFLTPKPNEKFRVAWTVALAASSWSAFVSAGFPIPNYNSLTYLGSLLTIIGLLGLGQRVSANERKRLRPYILHLINFSTEGLGISLAFFGKFSAAVILLLGLIAFLMMAGEIKQVIKQVLSSCLWAILWFLIFSAENGPLSVLEMIYQGAATVILMDSTYSPLTSIWKFVTSSFLEFAFASFIMSLTLILGYLRNGSRIHNRLAILISLNIGVLVIFWLSHRNIKIGR